MWERSAPFSLPYKYLDERPPGRNVHKNTPDHCKKIQVSLCCEKSFIWNVIAHARTCCGSVRARLAQHSHITVFFLNSFLDPVFCTSPDFTSVTTRAVLELVLRCALALWGKTHQCIWKTGFTWNTDYGGLYGVSACIAVLKARR